MDETPRISVVIATYNDAKALDRCLESLRHQTFRDFETIVVNDGSTDNVGEVVKKHDVRFVSYPENHGVSYARNKGIENANGRYLAFIDSDAVATDHWLEEISKHLDEKRVLTGKCMSIEGTEMSRGPRLRHYFGGSIPLPPFLSTFASAIYGANMVFPKSYFDQHGPFAEYIQYGFDESDMIARGKTYRVRYLDRAVVHHDCTKNTGRALYMQVRNNLISKLAAYRGQSFLKYFFVMSFFVFRSIHALVLLIMFRARDAKLLFRAMAEAFDYAKERGYV